jgi:threonine/homoserine/homoserine lactone efflux protein
MGLTVLVFTVYGLSSALIRNWVVKQPRVRKAIDWAMGSLFVFLGLKLAFSSRQ